ncbi:hypothetical protein M076_1855 [Bacteroides fragilis str. 2-F-2 |uniref:Uncharacterized protein n=1 Tax=Bacteroides fragilis str. 2-F-2 \|nr:hypothetical protein M077_1936 [Bacteroides fragilis str. 2-F-2 \
MSLKAGFMSISGAADIAYELNDRTKIGCSYPGRMATPFAP